MPPWPPHRCCPCAGRSPTSHCCCASYRRSERQRTVGRGHLVANAAFAVHRRWALHQGFGHWTTPTPATVHTEATIDYGHHRSTIALHQHFAGRQHSVIPRVPCCATRRGVEQRQPNGRTTAVLAAPNDGGTLGGTVGWASRWAGGGQVAGRGVGKSLGASRRLIRVEVK